MKSYICCYLLFLAALLDGLPGRASLADSFNSEKIILDRCKSSRSKNGANYLWSKTTGGDASIEEKLIVDPDRRVYYVYGNGCDNISKAGKIGEQTADYVSGGCVSDMGCYKGYFIRTEFKFEQVNGKAALVRYQLNECCGEPVT